jgi:hypothetical protein
MRRTTVVAGAAVVLAAAAVLLHVSSRRGRERERRRRSVGKHVSFREPTVSSPVASLSDLDDVLDASLSDELRVAVPGPSSSSGPQSVRHRSDNTVTLSVQWKRAIGALLDDAMSSNDIAEAAAAFGRVVAGVAGEVVREPSELTSVEEDSFVYSIVVAEVVKQVVLVCLDRGEREQEVLAW